MKLPSHWARFWSSLRAGDEITVCSVGRIRYNENSHFRLFSLPDNRMKPRAYSIYPVPDAGPPKVIPC